MSDITTIPSRAEFIRDRLAEWVDGYGYSAEPIDLPSGERLLEVDSFGGTTTVYVQPFGPLLDNDDARMRELTWRGFAWVAEPTDTGRIHGPMTAKVASLQDAAERFERADAARCGCPDDCGCRSPYRTTYCGCVGHRVPGTTRTV